MFFRENQTFPYTFSIEQNNIFPPVKSMFMSLPLTIIKKIINQNELTSQQPAIEVTDPC